MKLMKILTGTILLVLLGFSTARAQSCPYAHGGTASTATQSQVAVVSGSEATFVPSSFQKFDKAVALGSASAGASHSTFTSYDQAVRKGIADIAAQSKSPAQAAREYRNAK